MLIWISTTLTLLTKKYKNIIKRKKQHYTYKENVVTLSKTPNFENVYVCKKITGWIFLNRV